MIRNWLLFGRNKWAVRSVESGTYWRAFFDLKKAAEAEAGWRHGLRTEEVQEIWLNQAERLPPPCETPHPPQQRPLLR